MLSQLQYFSDPSIPINDQAQLLARLFEDAGSKDLRIDFVGRIV